jgi:hypothetical protein
VAIKTPRQWPPRSRDRFRGVQTIPEIRGGQLNAGILRSAVFHHGCLLVRGLVSETHVARLRSDIDQAVLAFDAYTEGDRSPTPWHSHFVGPDGDTPREFIRETGGVLAADCPPASADLVEAFEAAGFRDLATGFFGEAPLLLRSKCTLRKVVPYEADASVPPTAVDFHQDGSFMGADVRTLNIWLSLSNCGVVAPGLDVVPRRFDSVVEPGGDGALTFWTVSDSTTRSVSEKLIETPVFEPGDALLFDHLLLHRTALREGMTQTRHAIEAWFGASSCYPAGLNAAPY